MPAQTEHHVSRSQPEESDNAYTWAHHGSDFVLIAERRPPPRIKLARERMLICRLYLALMRTNAALVHFASPLTCAGGA
jgi:hypothetical protein